MSTDQISVSSYWYYEYSTLPTPLKKLVDAAFHIIKSCNGPVTRTTLTQILQIHTQEVTCKVLFHALARLPLCIRVMGSEGYEYTPPNGVKNGYQLQQHLLARLRIKAEPRVPIVEFEDGWRAAGITIAALVRQGYIKECVVDGAVCVYCDEETKEIQHDVESYREFERDIVKNFYLEDNVPPDIKKMDLDKLGDAQLQDVLWIPDDDGTYRMALRSTGINFADGKPVYPTPDKSQRSSTSSDEGGKVNDAATALPELAVLGQHQNTLKGTAASRQAQIEERYRQAKKALEQREQIKLRLAQMNAPPSNQGGFGIPQTKPQAAAVSPVQPPIQRGTDVPPQPGPKSPIFKRQIDQQPPQTQQPTNKRVKKAQVERPTTTTTTTTKTSTAPIVKTQTPVRRQVQVKHNPAATSPQKSMFQVTQQAQPQLQLTVQESQQQRQQEDTTTLVQPLPPNVTPQQVLKMIEERDKKPKEEVLSQMQHQQIENIQVAPKGQDNIAGNGNVLVDDGDVYDMCAAFLRQC